MGATRILICGATSMMAVEAAKLFAAQGAQFFLAARDSGKLRAVQSTLLRAGASGVDLSTLDFTEFDRHEALVHDALETMQGIDLAVITYGVNPNQKACESSADEALKAVAVNFTSAVSLLTLLANYFENERSGCIAVITFVAGDRGRRKHYVYGAAKGGLSVFLQGLRNRLQPAGVAVVDLRPGFVDTPMTASLNKNFLFTTSARAGSAIYQAIKHKKHTAYIPWWWGPIMTMIKGIPEILFKRLDI